jgi:hypothetical protein
MANAHNMVLAYYSNGARIPDDTWSRLPESSREAWQGIPTEDRKLIMGSYWRFHLQLNRYRIIIRFQ